MNKLLSELNLNPFSPLPVLRGPWAQTIAGRYWPQKGELRGDSTHVVRLADGDALALIENRPSGWKPGGRIAVLVHGLSGCSRSSYMTRLARGLTERGTMSVRVNLRGCGEGFGLARLPYHSGRSEDVRCVLGWLASHYPGSPVTLIGFSLGANIALKMAGEDSDHPTGRLDSVIAVSPPVDLAACAEHMQKKENRVFDRFFVRELVQAIERHHERYPELEPPCLPRRMTLNQFDDLYTAPRSGFKNAADYYSKSSSGQFVPKIAVPGLILCAKDDPIIDARAYERLPHRSNVDVLLTEHGGHVGFLGPSGRRPLDFRWMDRLILSWLARLQGHSSP